MAVGAGRLRLVRQLFTESALLVFLGAIAGLALAWWGTRLLLMMASDGPEALPLQVTPSWRILAFTIGVSALCAFVFGIAPALRASRIEPNTSLKGGKSTTLSPLKNPLGKAFVVAQVALSLLLLVGAGSVRPHFDQSAKHSQWLQRRKRDAVSGGHFSHWFQS